MGPTLRAADRLVHPTLEVVGVGEEEAVVESLDDDAIGHRRIPMERDVAIAAEVGYPTEHRVMAGARSAAAL